MLRASSVGLSLPSPTIFAIQQCRRLCGARNRWALVQNGRNITTIKPTTFPPAFPAKKHEHGDTDEKLRDVAPLPPLLGGERNIGPNASSVYSETVEEKDTSAPPAGASPRDTDTPDRTLDVEREVFMALINTDTADRKDVEREAFMALINEELENANVLSEIPPVAAWTSRIGVKPQSKDAIRAVEISQSLYAPLTRLISDLKTAHQERDVDGTVERDTDLAAVEHEQPAKPLPPRDTGAQIWKNLQILGRTTSTDDAWTAYVYLIDTLSEYPRVQKHIPQIPFSHLHRFCRVLSRHRPKTRRQFLRLLSVMMYTKHCGGDFKQWELNALIDLAGKGWRKTHAAFVGKQMDIVNDLLAGRMPGALEFAPEDQQMLSGPGFKPDVYTFTSLITVAARAEDSATLREVSAMMNNSGTTPNRVTHIAMLRFYEQKQDLSGLRTTLQRMRQLNIDLGVEGLNACITAYSKLVKLDVVLMIYRLLRHNVIPEVYRGPNDVVETAAQLAEEFIFVEDDMLPDMITYVSVIQSMTYHGHFRASMQIFLDMLSMTQRELDNSAQQEVSRDTKSPLDAKSSPDPSPETEAPRDPNPSLNPKLFDESSPVTPHWNPSEFDPTIAVYRAIFLGFARHAVKPHQVRNSKKDWTLDNLRDIFARFLLLPASTQITQAQLWMIMDAFGKTSDWDYDVMREAWLAIDRRFGFRLHKPDGDSALVRLRRKLFPDSD